MTSAQYNLLISILMLMGASDIKSSAELKEVLDSAKAFLTGYSEAPDVQDIKDMTDYLLFCKNRTNDAKNIM